MSKTMKRILIYSLILVLLLSSAAPVFAEEKPAETTDLTDTFYVITTGANHSLKVPFSLS